MKMFNEVKETVNGLDFMQKIGTGLIVVSGISLLALGVYCKGYVNGAVTALDCVDYGFKKADPEAYAKLVKKANALVESGVIH